MSFSRRFEQFDRWWRAPAPATRLAALRIAIGIYCVGLLLGRAPSLLRVAGRDAAHFEPVGLATLLDAPIGLPMLFALWSAALIGAVCVGLGYRYRVVAPAFALLLVFLFSYRSSFGHMSHTEQLACVHVLLLSVFPAADALSLDARAGRRTARAGEHYGWPLRVMMLAVVISYLLAGWAKLYYGGWAWVSGEVAYNQVAHDTLRKLRVGAMVSPIGPLLLRWPWLFTGASVATVIIELGAIVAMFGGRLRTAWVIAAWLMHVGIAATMTIAFPYPLWGFAFLSFFELEHGLARITSAGAGAVAARRGRPSARP